MRFDPQPYLQQLEAEGIHQIRLWILLRRATLQVSKQLPFIFNNENSITPYILIGLFAYVTLKQLSNLCRIQNQIKGFKIQTNKKNCNIPCTSTGLHY